MYSFHRLHQLPVSLEAVAYYLMIFPRLRPLLHKPDSSTIAVEARYKNEEVVGLAMAQINLKLHSAQLLSIYVKEEHRCAGIGTELITCLENILIEESCPLVYLKYPEDIPAAPAFEKILTRRQWSKPEVDMIMIKGLAESTQIVCTSEWLKKKRRLPPGYEIFLWAELTAEEREKILQRQAKESWYPEHLSPFRDEAIMEPLNSLGLRYQGEIVGWMINHRLDPDTIRYTPLFVSEEVRSLSVGFMLVTEAIRLYCEHGFLNYLFLFEPDSPIRKWAFRRFGEHAKVRNIMKSSKSLHE